MTNLFYSLPRYVGMFDNVFEFTVEGCEASEYFLRKLVDHGEKIQIDLDNASGYEIVIIANQNLMRYLMMAHKINYLLFRYDDESPRGGMRDLVSVFQSKKELFNSIETMINSPSYAAEYDRIHFYDIKKDDAWFS